MKMILDDPHKEPETQTQRDAALGWFEEFIAMSQPRSDRTPLGRVLLVRSNQEAAEASMVNDRHGWTCPCVACRIDRGED